MARSGSRNASKKKPPQASASKQGITPKRVDTTLPNRGVTSTSPPVSDESRIPAPLAVLGVLIAAAILWLLINGGYALPGAGAAVVVVTILGILLLLVRQSRAERNSITLLVACALAIALGAPLLAVALWNTIPPPVGAPAAFILFWASLISIGTAVLKYFETKGQNAIITVISGLLTAGAVLAGMLSLQSPVKQSNRVYSQDCGGITRPVKDVPVSILYPKSRYRSEIDNESLLTDEDGRVTYSIPRYGSLPNFRVYFAGKGDTYTELVPYPTVLNDYKNLMLAIVTLGAIDREPRLGANQTLPQCDQDR